MKPARRAAPGALVALLAALASTASAMHSSPRHIPGLATYRVQRAASASAQAAAQGQGADPASTSSSSYLEFYDGAHLDAATAQTAPGDIVQANFTQPLDHFDSSTTNLTFPQRYWFSLRHYRPPSQRAPNTTVPVFVLDSGETDAEGRLPYLDHGILDILARATGGIGVVLEHRYYGASHPPRSALGPGKVWTVDELRWLTNRQALEDSARFVQHVRFPGVDEELLQAPRTPYVYYGGSYPGARSAHMRLLYPHLIRGAIASSAVVAAVEEFPHYWSPIARGTTPDCVQALQAAVAWIDGVIAPEPHLGSDQTGVDGGKAEALLGLFNLKGLKSLDDFANLLTQPLGSFQALNWDAGVSSPEWARFCRALTANNASGPIDSDPPRSSGAFVPAELPLAPTSPGDGAGEAPWRHLGDDDAAVALGEVPTEVRRLAAYVRETIVDGCLADNSTAEACFGTSDWGWANNSTELTDNLAWTFQVCTTWGYFMTAPPVPWRLAAPATYALSAPKLVSSRLDLKYASEVCRRGFPPGRHFAVPPRPDVDEVNRLGAFGIDVDRLAFVDGQFDPWRPATVHSEEFAYGGARPDTLQRPFKLIANCWHHCDENGERPATPAPPRPPPSGARAAAAAAAATREPPRVEAIHAQEVEFVRAWLADSGVGE